jgi:hypothetical protein
MAKKFTELRAGMTQAAREKADGMARQMLAEMPLNELRQAYGGELDVVARFPDGSVKINNFTDLGAATPL